MTEPVIIGDATLYLGDCLEILPQLEAGSVDAVVTDPPAGIGFMGKKWDHDKGGRDQWIAWMSGVAAACLRVLKPGGYALVWALPRTSHWTATAWENAGFEVRDRVAYLFGSGFPKSLNVALEFEHELCEYRPGPDGKKRWYYLGEDMPMVQTPPFCNPMANQWVGWGTALKPAVEDWWLLRKPLEGTVAANVLAHGTGGLNIDGCRIGTDAISVHNAPKGTFAGGEAGRGSDTESYRTHQGRWPANVCHDGSEEVVGLFPQGGASGVASGPTRGKLGTQGRYGTATGENMGESCFYGDSGSAARFFYSAKCSRKDRNEGLDCTRTVKYNVPKGGALCEGAITELVASLARATSGLATVKWLTGESGESIVGLCPSASLSTTLTAISKITTSQILNLCPRLSTSGFIRAANSGGESGGSPAASAENSSASPPTTTSANQAESARGANLVVSQMLSTISDAGNWTPATNFHSTVKPTALMRWLVRLVTPPGGIVLDPFMGSGSTGKACAKEGFRFVGIESNPEYFEIAKRRIDHAMTGGPLLAAAETKP